MTDVVCCVTVVGVSDVVLLMLSVVSLSLMSCVVSLSGDVVRCVSLSLSSMSSVVLLMLFVVCHCDCCITVTDDVRCFIVTDAVCCHCDCQ